MNVVNKLRKRCKNLGIKTKFILITECITVTALLISYLIFVNDKIDESKRIIEHSLKDTAVTLANNMTIQSKLYENDNDGTIQECTKYLLTQLSNVDLVVIASQSGEKYSHPDETQIGQIFVGEDKQEVLVHGSSYYSIKKGSMGMTMRYFYPIYYKDKQVGFIMTGTYMDVIRNTIRGIRKHYSILLITLVVITFLLSNWFGTYFKRLILNMEPEEIATLYLQKEMMEIEQTNRSLRATVHEFKNTLHIILGLVQLEEYEEASSYIMKLQNMQKTQTEQYKTIEDPYVRAMLRSKCSEAKEKQVNLVLSPMALLKSEHGPISAIDLTVIIGNLMDNALDACMMSHNDKKEVEIYFMENDTTIDIQVSDNGVPMDPSIKGSYSQLGVSTKGQGRGTGMYLVKKKVDKYDGTIVLQEDGQMKCFRIHLSKGTSV